MNYPLALFFILAVIFGVLKGVAEISNVRENPDLGYRSSRNIFTFLFTDKY